MTAPRRRAHYIEVPAYRLLDLACRTIVDAYGTPYLVGSATQRPDWRDVDLRVIVDDQQWHAWYDLDPARDHWRDTRWTLHCSLLSQHLARATGLPIDLQIQSMTQATQYAGARHPLGIVYREPVAEAVDRG